MPKATATALNTIDAGYASDASEEDSPPSSPGTPTIDPRDTFLDATAIEAQWQAFSQSAVFVRLLDRLSAEDVGEDVIKINFILHVMGMGIYKHPTVRQAYQTRKAAMLPHYSATLLQDQPQRAAAIEKAIWQSLTTPIFDMFPDAKKSQGARQKVRKAFTTFKRRFSAEVKAFAENTALTPQSIVKLKRKAKQRRLPDAINRWCQQWQQVIQAQLKITWSAAIDFPQDPADPFWQRIKTALRQQCIRYFKEITAEAEYSEGSATLKDALTYLTDIEYREENGTFEDNGTEPPYSTENQIIRTLLEILRDYQDKCERIKQALSADEVADIGDPTDGLEEKEVQYDLNQLTEKIIIEAHFERLLPAIIKQIIAGAKQADYSWLCEAMPLRENRNWAMLQNHISLTQSEYQQLIASQLEPHHIGLALYNTLQSSNIYRTNRTRVDRLQCQPLSPVRINLAAARLVQKNQRNVHDYLKAHKRKAGDISSFCWESEGAEVLEQFNLSKNGVQSEIVKGVGAYAPKHPKVQSAKQPITRAKKARAKQPSIPMGPSILRDILTIRDRLACDDSTMAKILLYLHFKSITKPPKIDLLKPKELEKITIIRTLIFVTEPRRNISAYVTNPMTLQLIASNHLTWEQAFKGDPTSNNKSIMPMCKVGAAQDSRYFQRQLGLFNRHLGYDYMGGIKNQPAALAAEACLMKRNAHLIKARLFRTLTPAQRPQWVAHVCQTVRDTYTLS